MNPLVAPEAFARPGRTALSVNVNKVALLRNTRPLGVPDVVALARIALEAGAQGITVHPRPDARHIRAQDVHDLALLIKQWPHAELNVEGNPLHNLMSLVRELADRGLRPHQCTLVPDSVDQLTSDHGWQFPADRDRLLPLVDALRNHGIRVSLFMDPLPAAMRAAREVGADRVELYTESYARAHGTAQQDEVLVRYAAAARAASAAGLEVNAGHDLNRANLTDFLRAVPGVVEVSIGHALIADALELGLAETVRDYQRCIQRAFATAMTLSPPRSDDRTGRRGAAPDPTE
jgi:pyridoxine 5-phosphate synthase